MAKKNKEARQQIILECTEQKASGVPGMSRYISTKNRKNTPDRLELKKYNPFLRKVQSKKHQVFRVCQDISAPRIGKTLPTAWS